MNEFTAVSVNDFSNVLKTRGLPVAVRRGAEILGRLDVAGTRSSAVSFGLTLGHLSASDSSDSTCAAFLSLT